MDGKIPQGGATALEVVFQCSVEKVVNTPIIIKIRGGSDLKIPFYAEVSIPDVYIKEDDFNFGEIRYGNSGKLEMTLVNNSTLDTMLILDLRKKPNVIGIDGLSVTRKKPVKEIKEGDEEEEGKEEDKPEEEEDEEIFM